MSYLTDYCKRIRAWVDDEDIADENVIEWIRDAEERMNNELRTDAQIHRTYATFDDDCALLPPDWLETIYVRLKGGKPFEFVTNHDYWDLDRTAAGVLPDPTGGEVYGGLGRKMQYTHVGRTIFVYPPIDPEKLTQLEIAYYRQITPLGDAKDPVFDRYPAIYRNCTLAAGAPFLIEDERLSVFASLATAGISKANEASKTARFSGSPLPPRIRGFG